MSNIIGMLFALISSMKTVAFLMVALLGCTEELALAPDVSHQTTGGPTDQGPIRLLETLQEQIDFFSESPKSEPQNVGRILLELKSRFEGRSLSGLDPEAVLSDASANEFWVDDLIALLVRAQHSVQSKAKSQKDMQRWVIEVLGARSLSTKNVRVLKLVNRCAEILPFVVVLRAMTSGSDNPLNIHETESVSLNLWAGDVRTICKAVIGASAFNLWTVYDTKHLLRSVDERSYRMAQAKQQYYYHFRGEYEDRWSNAWEAGYRIMDPLDVAPVFEAKITSPFEQRRIDPIPRLMYLWSMAYEFFGKGVPMDNSLSQKQRLELAMGVMLVEAIHFQASFVFPYKDGNWYSTEKVVRLLYSASLTISARLQGMHGNSDSELEDVVTDSWGILIEIAQAIISHHSEVGISPEIFAVCEGLLYEDQPL